MTSFTSTPIVTPCISDMDSVIISGFTTYCAKTNSLKIIHREDTFYLPGPELETRITKIEMSELFLIEEYSMILHEDPTEIQ